MPILYSYRRCPYAMRARLAIYAAGITIELREIVLRNKPAHLLRVSPKGTVPVLILQDGTVIDQSMDIMLWALRQNDAEHWLDADLNTMLALIAENDDHFKSVLDCYKYPERYPQFPRHHYRTLGEVFLDKLETLLAERDYLFKSTASLADMAIFPFVRQFAAVDYKWFESSSYHRLQNWLNNLVQSALFARVMEKQPTYLA